MSIFVQTVMTINFFIIIFKNVSRAFGYPVYFLLLHFIFETLCNVPIVYLQNIQLLQKMWN